MRRYLLLLALIVLCGCSAHNAPPELLVTADKHVIQPMEPMTLDVRLESRNGWCLWPYTIEVVDTDCDTLQYSPDFRPKFRVLPETPAGKYYLKVRVEYVTQGPKGFGAPETRLFQIEFDVVNLAPAGTTRTCQEIDSRSLQPICY